MSLFTRPRFEDRQIVQYSGTSINLSGETYINNTGYLQINAPILDFTGTTSASTLYTLAGVSGYINEGLVSSFIVQPPILLQSGATGTTSVDVTGYYLGGLDSGGTVTWLPPNGGGGIDYWTSGSTGINSIKANNLTGLDATGDWSVAEGLGTLASGPNGSHAEGKYTIASGDSAHAEGQNTIAGGSESHAEGTLTKAFGGSSHSEGAYTTALGNYSHAEGFQTTAAGNFSHTEGFQTKASIASHAEGDATTAIGDVSHSEGKQTTAIGAYSHSEGFITTASGFGSHSEGNLTKALGDYGSHAEGSNTTAIGWHSHAEGVGTTSIGIGGHAEGNNTKVLADYGHAEGEFTTANYYSHAEGQNTTASGSTSHAEGYGTTSLGAYSHAEGYGTKAIGSFSHAEGGFTIAIGNVSHAEGQSTAIGPYSHSEGLGTTCFGWYSHAEGYGTTATGDKSHTEGNFTIAIGNNSHAGGNGSVASGTTSFVHGSNSSANGTSTIVLGNNITGTIDNTVYVANLNINGGLTLNNESIESSWTSYLPTWTASVTNPVLNDGTITGSYKLIGKTCFVRGRLTMGATTTYGSGAWYIGLPFTAVSPYGIIIPVTILDNGLNWYSALMNGGRLGSSTVSEIQWQNTAGVAVGITPTVPFTWGSLDELEWNGSYEIV